MKLDILQVPGCPNVQLLEDRIAAALAGEQMAVTITHRVLNTAQEAEVHGMTGSPTLLINGEDPFGQPGLSAGLSCRLYAAETGGGFDGAPSIAALRAALTSGAMVAALAAWRGSAQPAGPRERAVHRAILRGFADTGSAPPPDELRGIAADVPINEILGSLHAADVIRLDGSNRISSVYPFSATPTAHRVRIDSGVEVHAMCAIDALGVSAMLDRPVAISSADPRTGDPIAVAVRGLVASADPESVVVFVGAHSGQGPSAETCCGYLNFFTDGRSAQMWAEANPQAVGMVIDLATATQCGAAIFGSLLADSA